jgi:excisionase family DNA binding protein
MAEDAIGKPVSYTVKALAKHWGCHPKLVYSLIASGALQSWKLGGRDIRIRQSAVDEYEQKSGGAS